MGEWIREKEKEEEKDKEERERGTKERKRGKRKGEMKKTAETVFRNLRIPLCVTSPLFLHGALGRKEERRRVMGRMGREDY
ncbi:hypothetical protein E2C01_101632 [Portunus trituberculatus]|uniref:Uncharacterized protein n=1 Tax=Portunus trituberculatus TaxID=210409 RepID=A0A5B7K654_PORTR|nr:hypothetical protein [Portunus trituberculatus]